MGSSFSASQNGVVEQFTDLCRFRSIPGLSGRIMLQCSSAKRSPGGRRYLYLVESVCEGKRVRQRTIRALGCKDVPQASGELDRLIASLARQSERAMVLSDMEAGALACIRIGGPLLFRRLWERLGLGCVVNGLLGGRDFEFALERAMFVSVLHRLFVSGSDRLCEKWMVSGQVGRVFQAAGIALPPNWHEHPA